MDTIVKFIRRVPFTLATLLALSLVAIWTGTHLDQISLEWLNRLGFAPLDLLNLNLERLFTSALVTSGGRVFWQAFLMVALCVGAAEWLTGWKRTAATFWGFHLLALNLLTLIVAISHRTLREFGLEAVIVARDVGPSAGYFACLGLVSASLKRPWNWISGGVLLAIFLIALLMPASAGGNAQLKLSADLAHLLAFPLGWLSAGIGRHRKEENYSRVKHEQ
jgi:hypothetical protein